MSNNWTFTCTNGPASFSGTAAALGLGEVRRERRSQDIDLCTFTAPGRKFDAAPLFPDGSTVRIKYGNQGFFSGVVTQISGTGTPDAERQAYTLSGPWYYLAHLAARQEWRTPGAGAGVSLSSRLILGQDSDGTRQTTGETITALVQYAIDCGYPLAIGTINPDMYAPLDEVKDVTVAAAIQQVLRWHPDCVTWFDYTVSTPILHIRKRANLDAKSFAIGKAPLSSVSEITARKDLQVSAVVIHYEVTGQADGKETFNIITDAAPLGATGRELNALCVTLPLRGTSIITVEMRVVTREIIDDLAESGQADTLEFLASLSSDLRRDLDDPEITAEGITILSLTRTLSERCQVEPVDFGNPAGAQRKPVFNPDLRNQLIGGDVTDWMMSAYGIRYQIHTFTFTYTADSSAGGAPAGSLPVKTGYVDLSVTNAGRISDPVNPVADVYTTLTSYDSGDAVPTGLAAACYAAFSQLHYAGSITLIEEEATGAAGIGDVLNLTGGAQAAWSNMRAMIVSETVDVDAGTTSLSFGPPPHLAPADLLALLSVARPAGGVGRTSGSPAALGTGMSAWR